MTPRRCRAQARRSAPARGASPGTRRARRRNARGEKGGCTRTRPSGGTRCRVVLRVDASERGGGDEEAGSAAGRARFARARATRSGDRGGRRRPRLQDLAAAAAPPRGEGGIRRGAGERESWGAHHCARRPPASGSASRYDAEAVAGGSASGRAARRGDDRNPSEPSEPTARRRRGAIGARIRDARGPSIAREARAPRARARARARRASSASRPERGTRSPGRHSKPPLETTRVAPRTARPSAPSHTRGVSKPRGARREAWNGRARGRGSRAGGAGHRAGRVTRAPRPRALSGPERKIVWRFPSGSDAWNAAPRSILVVSPDWKCNVWKIASFGD